MSKVPYGSSLAPREERLGEQHTTYYIEANVVHIHLNSADELESIKHRDTPSSKAGPIRPFLSTQGDTHVRCTDNIRNPLCPFEKGTGASGVWLFLLDTFMYWVMLFAIIGLLVCSAVWLV